MAEYLGNDHAVALQKSLYARRGEIAANPMLANGGRILNVLDVDAYGMDAIRRDVARDGYVGFTMVERDFATRRLPAEFGGDATYPSWDAFTGAPEEVLPVCEAMAADAHLPAGWRMESYKAPDEAVIDACQTLNLAAGVAPTPAYFLRGEDVPATLTCLWDETGALAACASGTMRYHPEGPMAGWLFAGGVSVSAQHRRRGLGALVNARLLIDSHAAFSWAKVLEQAQADNVASVGMITRCGLTHDPDRVTVLINATGGHVTR